MPFSPTALPWWGWLLCAAGIVLLAAIAWALSDADDAPGLGCLAFVLALVALLTGALGVVQFVKWAWQG